MFIDQEYKQEEKKIKQELGQLQAQNNTSSNNLFLFIGIGLVAAAIMAVILYFFVFRKPITPPLPPTGNETEATSTIGTLPEDMGGNGTGKGNGTSTDELSPEKLTFGYFYEKPAIDFEPTLEGYDLPINLKVDVVNYYDISRKLNLDPYIDYINRDGFAVSSNQLGEEADDFFGVYRNLLSQKIPVVITSDFLLYYYQNAWKSAYKDIEKNVFYENVWDINKELFEISAARYKRILSQVGEINNPILEAARLETAYYAVALELLVPMESQINRKENFVDSTRFNDQEDTYFVFDLPPYLDEDVRREVELIREAKSKIKSPVFLYDRDYQYFNVPLEYKDNAKLNNFYLTMKWLNSVFPLYYQDNDCPDCLLDRDDWVISLTAASFISQDLYRNQDLKSKWAVIYKFISFFSGLRQDLTYLNYNEALNNLFGEEYNVEEIFSLSNEKREENIANLQQRISEDKFSLVEGSLSRDDVSTKPKIGMRMLQEKYWPNDYVMNYLVGKEMSSDSVKNSLTSCNERGVGTYRCRGFGLDILNLISPPEVKYDYFADNIDYSGYDQKMSALRGEIEKFDVNTWNNNIYWATLDMAKNLVDYDNKKLPVYYENDQWKRYKDYNSFLGTWVNLHLPGEKLVNYYDKEENSYLGGLSECNFNNYIEPNLNFYEELKAKNEMLLKMLAFLKEMEKTLAVTNQLKELNSKLEIVIEITKKELSDEIINEEECQFINILIKNYSPEKKAEKTFAINFEGQILSESIEGVKLLMVVYKKENDRILAIGPVFNYSEK